MEYQFPVYDAAPTLIKATQMRFSEKKRQVMAMDLNHSS